MIFDILTSSRYRKVNAKAQNDIILSFKRTNDNFERVCETVDATKGLYEEYRDRFISLILQLDKSLSKPKESTRESIIVEIENKLNEKDGSNATNKLNEKKANEIKEKANRYYLNKKFSQARELYQSAIDLEGVSDFTMSVLYLNTTATYYEESLSLSQNPGIVLPDNEDYHHLLNGKALAFHSLCLRPTYTKAYMRLARIHSKMSNYKYAIQLLNSALQVEPNAKEFVDFRKELVERFKIRNKQACGGSEHFGFGKTIPSMFDFSETMPNMFNILGINFRDHNQEAKDILAANPLKGKFGGQSVTDEFVEQILAKDPKHPFALENFKEICRKYSIAEKMATEYLLIHYAGITVQSDPTTSLEIYSRLIESDTQYAGAYFQRASYRIFKGFEIDNETCLSLYIKASFLPVSFHKDPSSANNYSNNKKFNFNDDGSIDIGNNKEDLSVYLERNICNNAFVVAALTQLGTIYRHGKNGIDIDFEKAKYYYELAIENSKKPFLHVLDQFINVAYFNLGHMYLNGRINGNSNSTLTNSAAADRRKCKELWMQGASQNFSEPLCYNYLKQEFGRDGDYHLNEFLKTVEKKQKQNESENMRIDGNDYFNTESQITIYTIDFPQVLQLSQKGSEWAKQIYTTYGKVVSFITLYDAAKNKTPSEKLAMIEPLANAFRDYESYPFVKLGKRLDGVKDLVNELLKQFPSNMDVRICWIGLNRFKCTDSKQLRLEFVNESMKLLSKSSANYSKDISSLQYYHCVFLIYNGKFKQALTSAYNYQSDKSITQRDKDIYIYMMSSASRFLSKSSLVETPDFENIFKTLVDSSSSTSKLANDDPCRAELYFNLALLSSKIGVPKKHVLDVYSKGVSVLKIIPPIIKVNHKLDRCSIAIKQMLNIK